MSGPTAFAMHVPSGTAGASHTLTNKQFSGFVPGQAFYLGALYKATRTSGAGILTLKLTINWYDSAGAALTATEHSISINASTSTFLWVENKHIAPANAIRGEVKIIVTPAASPMQHDLWVTAIRLGKTQAEADVTSFIDGPATESFAHSYDNVAESGQFPRGLTYTLKNAAGSITSGIVWTYTVLSGTVNGFTLASGVQSITGSGAVTLTISSMATSVATVEVKAVYNGATRVKQLQLSKALAPPPSGGGGGGSSTTTQTSGFVILNAASNTYATISATSPVLSTTLGTGKTQVDISINLAVGPSETGATTGNNIEVKAQRDIASVWTDVGSTINSDPDPKVGIDPDTFERYTEVMGSISGTINNTGLTAGNTYTHRVQARWTSGSTHTFDFTGTILTQVP
jgi:hypothetical protein